MFKQKCEAVDIQIGDNTYFGKVTKVTHRSNAGITVIEFDNAQEKDFFDFVELTFWED